MKTNRTEKKRVRLFRQLLALSMGIAVWSVPLLTSAQDEDASLEASTKALLEAYNTGAAATMSELFVEDGELVLSNGEMVIGRSQLRQHYEEVFADPERSQAAIEVGSIRLLTETLAIEDGTVHLTSPEGVISSFFYQAVRTRQGDEGWKLASLRDVEGDETLPVDKLSALEWLIGDWLIQTKNGETWISFFWSDAGPYLDAKAVSESPEAPAVSATMRIGWNEKEEAFKSWGFDARGGFNGSDWVSVAPGDFLLRTVGVTSDGESNVATQLLKMSVDGQSFTWTKKDQFIDGSPVADQTITAVKRPPVPEAE